MNQAWLKTVGYPSDCSSVSSSVILETLRFVVFSTYDQVAVLTHPMSSVLEKAGFVKSPDGGFEVSQFVNTEVAKLA